MNCEPVLVINILKNEESYSGLLINSRYILTTCHIARSSLKTTTCNSSESDTLAKVDFKQTYSICLSEKYAKEYKAKIIFTFKNKDVEKSIDREFRQWDVDVDCEEVLNIKNMLSTFFVLEVFDDGIDWGCEKAVRSCLARLYEEVVGLNIYVGSKVEFRSTPFGVKSFLNCYNEGIISNIFGHTNCLMVLDYPGVPGCEGGSIFLREKSVNSNVPVGLLLCCLSAWKQSSIGLMIGVTLKSLLSSILQDKEQILEIIDNNTNHYKSALFLSLGQVICGSSWGTAILVDKEQGIFITCSHVIENEDIIIHWEGAEFQASVIFAVPANGVYDIAILKVDSPKFYLSNMKSIKMTYDILNVGDQVYAAGFSLFPKTFKPKPIITKGVISKVKTSVVHTTCTILPGTSGGALINEAGLLVGLIVANISTEELKYPKINMVVPMSSIGPTLQKYLKTKDITILDKLSVTTKDIIREWDCFYSKL